MGTQPARAISGHLRPSPATPRHHLLLPPLRRPPIADIATVPFVKRIDDEIAPDQLSEKQHPRITDWWARIQVRPAFARANIGPFATTYS